MSLPNAVPEDVYPSSSQDGTAIPLATVRPFGAYSGPIAGGAELPLALPEEINLVSFYCTSKGTLFLDEVNLAPGYKAGAFVFLPEMIYELTLPANCIVVAEEAGDLIVNILMRWSQIRNPGSYRAS